MHIHVIILRTFIVDLYRIIALFQIHIWTIEHDSLTRTLFVHIPFPTVTVTHITTQLLRGQSDILRIEIPADQYRRYDNQKYRKQ